jgi:hypothetical protein
VTEVSDKEIVPMQTQTRRARRGKHAKGTPHSTAHRILVTGLLLGGLAAGSLATAEFASATGSMSAHHQNAIEIIVNSPWMY